MFVIGIDPHKRSHTAAVLDDTEELVGQLRVNADRWQRDRLVSVLLVMVTAAVVWGALGAWIGVAGVAAVLLLWAFFAVRNRDQWLPNWRRPTGLGR